VRKLVMLIPVVVLVAGCSGSSTALRPNVHTDPASTGNGAVCRAVDSFVTHSGLVVTSLDKEQAFAKQLKRWDVPGIASSKLRSEIPVVTNAISALPSQTKRLQDALSEMLETCSSLGYPLTVTGHSIGLVLKTTLFYTPDGSMPPAPAIQRSAGVSPTAGSGRVDASTFDLPLHFRDTPATRGA
jgi:hypothetical protein